MDKDVIIEQAIETVTPTSCWVYCRWKSGKLSRYQSETKYSERMGGYTTHLGYSKEVDYVPSHLNWIPTGKK